MKPTCNPCERFMRIKKTGFYFIEGMPIGKLTKPGKEDPEHWVPYKFWAGDLYACPTCGAETIVGTGNMPIAEHYMPDFRDIVERVIGKPLEEVLMIKDC